MFFTALPPYLQLMKFDPELVPHLGADDGVEQTVGHPSDDRRALGATLSDPSSGHTDLPPVGHVRVSAKYDLPETSQEPSRVGGRRSGRGDSASSEEVASEGQRRKSSGK